MEVFKVFATMSLVDMISNPLGKIEKMMGKVGNQVNTLSGKMGNLAISMAPVAAVAASLIMSFGVLSAKAMDFESSMASVARVVRFDTAAELKAMGDTILDMSSRIPVAADTLSAVMAAAAMGGIAKKDLAGFTEQAAKTGVAFGMAGNEAADVLTTWRSNMGLSLTETYALADAVSFLSRELGASAPALAKVIQNVGPLAMAAGLAETQVAALGAAFLSVGASPEAATSAIRTLSTTLTQGTAMSDKQADAFKKLGFSATQMAKAMQTDAQGTITSVLKALSEKPKDMQMSLMSEIFSMRDLPAITPLLANFDSLSAAFAHVADSATFAGSMEQQYAAASDTARSALHRLRSRLMATAITMGNAFLPAIKAGAEFLGDMVEGVRVFMATPFAQWLLKITAALSGAIIGVTAFAAGIWLVKAAVPLIGKALAPLKAALLSISWPVWAIIAAFAAFYLAYKTNFGGFADFVNGVWNKVSLIFNGVKAVISSMTDGVGAIRGELGQQIKAEGLLGIVTTISKVYYRITRLFAGIGETISPYIDAVGTVFQKTFGKIAMWFDRIGTAFGSVIAKFSGSEVTSAASSWQTFGNVLGHIYGWTLEMLATGIQLVVNALSIVLDFVLMTCAAFTGDFANASALFNSIMGTIGESILAIADLFGFGDWLRESWQGAMDFLYGINLYECGARILTGLWDGLESIFQAVMGWFQGLWDDIAGFFGGVSLLEAGASLASGFLDGLGNMGSAVSEWCSGIWDGIIGFFSGISLADSGQALMETLGQGVLSAVDSLVGAASNALSKLRNLLPFSDAKEGPLSDLTTSGGAIMATLGEGVLAGQGGLVASVSGVFDTVSGLFGSAMDWLTGGDAVKGPDLSLGDIAMPDMTIPDMAIPDMAIPQEGVSASAMPAPDIPDPSGLVASVSSVFDTVSGLFGGAMDWLTGGDAVKGPDLSLGDVAIPDMTIPQAGVSVSAIPAPDIPDVPGASPKGESGGSGRANGGEGGISIHIGNLSLPDVTDAQGFVEALQGLMAEYDGVPA